MGTRIVKLLILCTLTATATFGCKKAICNNPEMTVEQMYDCIMRSYTNPPDMEYLTVNYAAANKNIKGLPNLVVFTGSSTLGGWKTLEADFANYHVRNRAYSGCKIETIISNYDTIVGAQPSALVIYTGDNDMVVKSYELFEKQLDCLIYTIKRFTPNMKIIFVSTKPGPGRREFFDKFLRVNKRVEEIASTDEKYTFVDIWNPMFVDGKVDESLFLPDMLHPSAKGFTLMASIIEPAFKKLGINKKGAK